MAEDAVALRAAPRDRSLRALARAVAASGLVLVALASVLSLAGRWWWALDLLSHFHAVYLLFAALATAGLAALRWWGLARWAGALAAIEAVLVLPLYVGVVGGPEPDAGAPRLRVVSYNMLHGNPGTAEAARHVAGLEPDVVVLIEATASQVQAFTTALPGWYAIAEPRDDAFGIAVLSRRPPSSARVIMPGPRWMPAIELVLPLGGQQVTIYAVHPPPPIDEAHARTRDELLRTVSRWAAEREGPVIVAGDLNATPWSAPLRELLDEGPLRSTQRFGLHATWPSRLGALGIPIDHVLVSGSLHPVRRSIEPGFGSDHRMVVVELALSPR